MLSAADQAVNIFKARHPDLGEERSADGSWRLLVHNVPIDAMIWNKPASAMAFIIPAAFPVQQPDCFWTDADLRLRTGAMPSNAGPNVQPFGTMLWFSYHPNTWDVRCTVETYFHLVQGRLREAR